MNIAFLNSCRHLHWLSLCLLLAVAHPARAAVTNIAWYRLGENDAGAASGGVVTNTTMDFVGGNHLQEFGSPRYTNDTDLTASLVAGSVLGIQFNGAGQSLSNAPIPGTTNNFCAEMWVRPNAASGGPFYIAVNGNVAAGGNGWGIFQQGDQYRAVLGGITTIISLSGMAQIGQWTHLALVQDSGFTTLYVNGAAVASTSSRPRLPTIGFALGTHPHLPAGDFFSGAIDEVRVFRFGTSQFTVNDTLLGARILTTTATDVTPTNAILNGYLNPMGLLSRWWFEWGTTTNYGNVTPVANVGVGAGSTNFAQLLTAIGGGVTYHYRAVASNNLGVAFGTNQSFSTPLFMNINAPVTGVVASPGILRSRNHSAAWGDYDGDGRLDIALSVTNGSTTIWRNTGAGFTNALTLPGYSGPVTWTDFNNDGRLDLARVTDIARNTGSGFDFVPIAFLVPSGYTAAGWTVLGDYNADGRLDALFAGYISQTGGSDIQISARLAQNVGGGFIDVGNAPVPVERAAWGDFDGDGRSDLALAGRTNVLTDSVSQLWRNTGNGFTNFPVGLPDILEGAVTWGDYDNDGRLDLVLTGSGSSGVMAQIWRNTGSGFTNIQAGLPGVTLGAAEWGDYDNDGWSDLLLSGKTNSNSESGGAICQLWRNTGSGFVLITNAALPALSTGTAAWGDYDNDGRLDILLAGLTNWTGSPTAQGSGPLVQIWRNLTPVSNTPPTVPGGLAVTRSGGNATFSWNASTDAQTPTAGLSYNLRVGTTPGGSEIVSAMSVPSGRRLVPESGNAGQRLSRTIVGVPIGVPLYWSVQAVDNGFAGSAFATEQSFTLNTVFTPPNGIPVSGDTSGDGIVSQSELNEVLANYFSTSPWLQMTNVAGLASTNVTFALTNDLTGAFSVEYTTDFANWQFLGPATPRYLFTDTNAPAVPQRYYRLRWP